MDPLTAKAMTGWTMLAVAFGLAGAWQAGLIGAAIGVGIALLMMLSS